MGLEKKLKKHTDISVNYLFLNSKIKGFEKDYNFNFIISVFYNVDLFTGHTKG